MKQHITIEQWKQLAPGQQDRFASALDAEGADEYSGDSFCPECGDWGLPSIGQLIEFLAKSVCYSDISWIDVSGLDHQIQGQIEHIGEPLVTVGWAGGELIDVLWNEVSRALGQIGQGGK